jgi:hypothetical protein
LSSSSHDGGTRTPLVAVVLAAAPLDAARARAAAAAAFGNQLGELRVDVFTTPWPDDAPDGGAPEGQLPDGDDTSGDARHANGLDVSGLAPFSLERAAAQPHLWPAGAAHARRHRCHARLSVTPREEDLVAAQLALMAAARALLADPASTAVFFPRGEALRDGQVLGLLTHEAAEQEGLPLQAFTNGRIADPGNGWLVADIVGLGQLGAPDQEAAFPADLAPRFEVLGFLYDLGHHLVTEGGTFEDGITLEGPGGKRWMARRVLAPLVEPPRPCVRWLPLGLAHVPEPFLR